MTNDLIGTQDVVTAVMGANAGTHEEMKVVGRYTATFRDADGNVYHEETFDNLVTTVGKQLLLDSILGPTTTYTLVGPFMGLMGASSTGPAATDTIASHGGWTEAGSANPQYANRLTVTFAGSTVSSPTVTKASTTPALTFTFTSGGTVYGAFILTGTGATNVNGATTGTLFSAGLLTTAQPVITGNTLTLTYSTSLN
jgi:hypothetical protein